MANYDLTYEGSEVQGILNTGNSLKDAGYIFRGEATPSTVPGTPTERVAYIGGPGTYTNFGSSITVGAGCICVFKYTGSAWSNQVINTGLDSAVNTLQSAITAINNNIGNGYVYAGVATPSTSPVTGKVFYLAVQAGTYTNFGNAVVTAGLNVIKYNGSAWSVDQVIAIDAEPTQGSANLVKSGGVLNSIIQNGPAFDLSAYNAQGGVLATYADLNAALTALNALPADFKKGGMSMKFVQTSDNKYIQFRYMGTEVTGTPNPFLDANNWSFCGDDILAYNPELIAAWTDDSGKILFGIKKNGDFFFVKGVPEPIVQYVSEIYGQYIENPEFVRILTDPEKRILLGIKKDGDVFFGKGVPTQIKEYVENNQKNNEVLSKRYVKSKATLGIGSNWFGRTQTLQYYDEACNELTKAGMGFIRTQIGSSSELSRMSPPVYNIYKRGLKIIGLPINIEACPIADVAENIAWYVNTFDGNLHDYLLLDDEQIRIKVDYWCVFNEPDLNWVGREDELFERLKITYTTIKSIRPECKVILGGFASFTTNNFFDDFSNIRDDEGKAFWDYCDIIGYHLYSTDYSWLQSQFVHFKEVAEQHYSINEYSHLSDMPVWCTECGTIPFTEVNAEANRCVLLPKSILQLLSYGVENIITYRAVDYNMFSLPSSRQSYYGLISPQFNCAWAGFHYNDSEKTSLTPDELLDKTYIFSEEGQINNAVYLPHLTLSEMDKAEVLSKGIAINGNGYTVKKIIVGDFQVVSGGVYSLTEVRELWSGSTVMDGTNYITINGSSLQDSDFEHQVIVEIDDITMYDTTVDSFTYKDSYYSVKFLSSLLKCVTEQPAVLDKSLYSIAKLKNYDGTITFGLWANDSNVAVSLVLPDDAMIFDVKGNRILSEINVLTQSPIYITGVYNINININN